MPKSSDQVWSLQYLPAGRQDGWLPIDGMAPTGDPTNVMDDAQLAADDLGVVVRILLDGRQLTRMAWPRVVDPDRYPPIIVGGQYVQLGTGRRVPRIVRVMAYTPFSNRAAISTVQYPQMDSILRPSVLRYRRDIAATSLHASAVTRRRRPRTTGYVRSDGWTGGAL